MRPLTLIEGHNMIRNITEDEFSSLHDWASNLEEGGCTRYPGMSYEDGIKAVIEWVWGICDRPDLEQ